MNLVEYPVLAEVEPGFAAAVVEVRVKEPEQLRYLGSLGLYPGAEVVVVESAPFDGPLSLEVAGETRVIAHSLARRIHVTAHRRSERSA